MKRGKQTNTAARKRALAVLARMRSRRESLAQATRAVHTSPRTVRKFYGKQLRRDSSGRYTVTPADRLRREINVLTHHGYVTVVVRSSKKAKLASEHLIAVNRFLRTGNAEWLKPFFGKRVGGVELLTDTERLRELAEADLVKLDGLYQHNRAGRQEE